MIAKKKKQGNLIKILCVLLGAVFAFTTSVVYAAFSWSRSHNSGYATGMYLPNQSYQIINDSLPNGIPFGDGAKEYEIALQYSYDYNFKFYVEYSLEWTGGLDSSNVILNFSNRDAWIVDNSRIYYRDTVQKGTGKLPIIVGVNFADCYDETYNNKSLKINITNVKIVKESETLDQSGTAGSAYAEYQARKASSYTGTDAFVVMYNQTDKGSYKPKAPEGKTAFRSGSVTNLEEGNSTATTSAIKKIFGNKNYVGVGAYIITGASTVKIKARAVGNWVADTGSTSPSDVHVVNNTIKYDFADNWTNETYPSDNTQVQEIRTYSYIIPAHTAVYVDILDSVEVVTRGYYSNADYSNFHIETIVNLNELGNITTRNGIGTATITTITDSSITATMPTSSYSVINTSKYDAALYQSTATGAETFKTQIRVVNNTANKLSVSASYAIKVYISNGNATAEYGTIYDFTDSTHWARDVFTSTTRVTIPTGGSKNSSQIIAPYSAMTICTSFQIANGLLADISTANSAYSGSDVWVELVPTITATTSTADDSQLVLETEISGTTAKLYAKNLSSNVLSGLSLSVSYSYYSNQLGMTEFSGNKQTTAPANWDRNYWKYYIKNGSTYVQNTNSAWSSTTTYYTFAGWQTATNPTTKTISDQINPGEKVLMGTMTVTSAQIYDFSNYTLTGTVESSVADVQFVNETTGVAYFINNSTTKSYYLRFNGTVTDSNGYFFTNAGYSYFAGLIRPGQIIPVSITATDTVISASTIEDTTGMLISSAELTTVGWPTAVLANYQALYK